jgi:hypothetical protein
MDELIGDNLELSVSLKHKSVHIREMLVMTAGYPIY